MFLCLDSGFRGSELGVNHRSIEITQFELPGSERRAAPTPSRGQRIIRNSASANEPPTSKAKEFGVTFSAGSDVEVLTSHEWFRVRLKSITRHVLAIKGSKSVHFALAELLSQKGDQKKESIQWWDCPVKQRQTGLQGSHNFLM